MKTKIVFTLSLYAILSLPFGESWGGALANNPYISSINYSLAANTISFTISWDNSWNVSSAPSNYDAMWVFVKYQTCGTPNSSWAHVDLSNISTDHTISCVSGCTAGELVVDAVTDGKGVFVRRASGTGNTGTWLVTLKINPSLGGTQTSYNFKVFGIEMVHISQEDFQVGDGTGTNTYTYASPITAAIQSSGILGTTLGGGAADLPSSYPMGQGAFYCMKHEITQGQYVDFLNTLLYDQQKNRTLRSPDTLATYEALYYSTPGSILNRNGIKISTPGFNNTLPAIYSCDLNGNNSYYQAADGFHVACNYLSWADLIAYLDWAALRPMTDLEYEKICRGASVPSAGEYPWGTTNITSAVSSSLNTSGQITETSTSSGNGLCAYDGAATDGPLRIGFAATSITTRETAGASYYGVLDMGGNVWERVVATDLDGSSYTGTLGDGAVDASGNSDLTIVDGGTWPSYSTAAGTGYRGGAWNTPAASSSLINTSDRTYAATADPARVNSYGGRGVR